jgi:hypothetical protein
MMKCSKVLIQIILMGLFVTTASAQFKSWSKLTSFNGGYASLVGEYTGNTMDGYAFDFTYEQVNMEGNLAGGIIITYLAGHDKDSKDDRRINYQSIPIMFQGKYFFGPAKYKGYLQGGIGLQFSRIEFSGPNILLQDGDSGFTGGLGLGGYFFTDEKMFINVAYNFSYQANSFYRNGIVHLLKVGIGFQKI